MEAYKLLKSSAYVRYHGKLHDEVVDSTPDSTLEDDSCKTDTSDSDMCKLLNYISELETDIDKLSSSELTDDEISDIMSYMLMLHDKYFNDIPLKNELCKQFVWNIPRDIYEVHLKIQEYDYPDYLDPLMTFYMFIIDSPDTYIPQFISRMYDIMDENQHIFDGLGQNFAGLSYLDDEDKVGTDDDNVDDNADDSECRNFINKICDDCCCKSPFTGNECNYSECDDCDDDSTNDSTADSDEDLYELDSSMEPTMSPCDKS